MRKIFIVFLIFLGACKNGQIVDNDNGLIEIESKEKSQLPFIRDSIVSNFFFLQLETVPHGLLGSIDKILISKERIFISDKSQTQSVFIFDEFGKFIKKIEGGHKGPGEFIRPMSITMNYMKSNLIVMGDRLQKIITYDKNGIFLKEETFKFTSNDIALISNSLFAFNSGYSASLGKIDFHDLIYTSDSGRLNKKFKSLPEWRQGTIFNKDNAFCQYIDTIWYSPVYCDTIFLISENGPIPFFKINFEKSFINNLTGPKVDFSALPKDYISAVSNFQKAGDFVYISYSQHEQDYNGQILHHVFCDLSNKNIKTGVSLLSSPITDALFTYPIGTNGSDFIGAIEAIDVIQRIEMQLSRGQDISQALQNLRASISPGDNPVLVFYRLKSFE